jgi:hypothetical protein
VSGDGAVLVFGSRQVTVWICVAGSSVRFCVAVTVDCTCDVAVTTMMLEALFVPGIVAGAVYNPPLVIDPALPLPPPLMATLQFTRVLLRLRTVAVHCEVVRTVTSLGVHETVIVGVAVVLVLDPQEVTNASAVASPTKKNAWFQRDLTVSK